MKTGFAGSYVFATSARLVCEMGRQGMVIDEDA
jgi:hypothetical protein